MGIEITVVICTHNRAELLDGALASLCRQAISEGCFEIIVIDNGSTDNTADCVQGYVEKYPNHMIRRIYEAERGAGLARNVALHQALGRYVAFMDDDARAPSDWLAQALDKISAESQRPLLCLGGPIQPFYTSPKPDWFKDEYESRSWGIEERLLQSGESFSGSNMIWYRADLLTLGGFAEHVGPKGQTLSMGEETAAFVKAWEQFEKPLLWYMPTLIVQHWAPTYKMKVLYRLKRAFVGGQVAIKLNDQPDRRWHAILKHMKGVLSHIIIALRQYKRYPFWQSWAVETGGPIMSNMGMLLAAMGIFIQVKQR